MKLKIKESCLDLIVSCPFSNRIVQLRFLEESLYKYYVKYYPNYFENKKIK